MENDWFRIGICNAYVGIYLSEFCHWITRGSVGGHLVLLGVVIWRIHRCLAQAWASIQNRQLGFQVLTSLAVIGASVPTGLGRGTDGN